MKTHAARRIARHARRATVEELESRMLLASGSALDHPVANIARAVAGVTAQVAGNLGPAATASTVVSSASAPAYTLSQTLSDQAQLTTLAFDGLAMITGNLDAQSFFPPGKVADYFGFQYLRDNDPDNMGHNTSFLTRAANDVISSLSDTQFSQLVTLATAQLSEVKLYALDRYPLMEAFRRVMDGNLPSGSSGLSLDAVKSASSQLYVLDGQISFERASLYASVINSLSSTQKTAWDAMKGVGFNSWPVISDAQIQTRMRGLPQGTAELVMTYASVQPDRLAAE